MYWLLNLVSAHCLLCHSLFHILSYLCMMDSMNTKWPLYYYHFLNGAAVNTVVINSYVHNFIEVLTHSDIIPRC